MSANLDANELELLQEANQLIRTFQDRLANVPLPAEPGSDLAVDEANTLQIVHPAQSAKLLLTNVSNCLRSAIVLSTVPGIPGVSPIEILLRTALIGACRASLIVEPDDQRERRANAVDIAHADFHSANRAWSVMGSFEHTINGVSDAQSLFGEFFRQFPPGRAPVDGGFVNKVTESLVRHYQDPLDAEFVREQMLMIWHGYSGAAHANTWQHSLSGALNGVSESLTTGPLFHHLNLLAKFADFCLTMLEQRTRVRTSA